MEKMTAKQKLFCDEYLIDLNATQAAIRAGYSKKNARNIASETLAKPYIKAYIDKRLKGIENTKIADAQEVMEYLTSVLRGESQSEVIAVVSTGRGKSVVKKVKKAPDEKERLEAAKQLGKRYGLNIDKEEQKVRLEKMKAETARITGETADGEVEDDGFLEALNGSAREDWSDEED